MGSRVRKLLLGSAAFGSTVYLTSYFLNGESIFSPLGQVKAAEVKKSQRRAKRQLPPRSDQIKSLQSEAFDILIIGGGATGAGCALDAVTRGMLLLLMLRVRGAFCPRRKPHNRPIE